MTYLPAGLCGLYPPSSQLHWPLWCRVWRCSFYFLPRQHVDCSTSALLLMHFALTECSSELLLQFFLEPLRTFCFASLAPWKVRQAEALLALSCSYSLCWQSWGYSLSGSTLSMLPGWQHNFNYSSQISSLAESGLCIWLCWWTSPWIAQRQLYIWGQLLATSMELWQATATCCLPVSLGGWNTEDPQEVQGWSGKGRLED